MHLPHIANSMTSLVQSSQSETSYRVTHNLSRYVKRKIWNTVFGTLLLLYTVLVYFYKFTVTPTDVTNLFQNELPMSAFSQSFFFHEWHILLWIFYFFTSISHEKWTNNFKRLVIVILLYTFFFHSFLYVSAFIYLFFIYFLRYVLLIITYVKDFFSNDIFWNTITPKTHVLQPIFYKIGRGIFIHPNFIIRTFSFTLTFFKNNL